MHVRTGFPYLGNGWRDCAEICMVRDPLAMRFTQTNGGVHLYVTGSDSISHFSMMRLVGSRDMEMVCLRADKQHSWHDDDVAYGRADFMVIRRPYSWHA